MDILIGTKNKYKVGEMIYLLEDVPNIKIHNLEEVKLDIEVEEDGKTLLENAQKKAREISRYTNYYVLTSDVGVDIPGLGDKWNMLKNQRIVGKDNTDLEKANKVLELMIDLEGERRKIETHMAVALAKDGEIVWSEETITERGYIVEKLPDENIPAHGWMSHLIFSPKYQKVLNHFNKEEQDAHRKEGIASVKEVLKVKINSLQPKN